MKTKKITKKRMHQILTNGNRTEVHKLASMMGVDANNKIAVFNFIKENAKTNKAYNRAYNIALCRDIFGRKSDITCVFEETEVLRAIRFAKHQKKNGFMDTNYGKVLIEGNRNIYWAHPGYKHDDYNKSRAMENTSKNRYVSELINIFLRN